MWIDQLDLGLVQYMFYPDTISGAGPIVESIEECLADGSFGIIDITHANDPTVRRQVAEVLRGSSVRVVFAGTAPLAIRGLSLASLDCGERKAAIACCFEMIDEAIAANAETVFFASGSDPGPSKRERAYQTLADSVRLLCEYASTRSTLKEVVVALEPADREVQHRQLVGPFREAASFANLIAEDFRNFGLIIDQSHIQQLGEQPEAVFSLCAPHIRHVHLANAVVDDPQNPLYGDQHPPFGVQGGRVDIQDLARFIEVALACAPWRNRMRPSMSLEIKSRPGENPFAVVSKGKSDFAVAWAQRSNTVSGGIDKRGIV